MIIHSLRGIGIVAIVIGLYYLTKGLAIVICVMADEINNIDAPKDEYSYNSIRGKPRMIESGTNKLYVEINGKKHYVDN
jgi:hypothetical protein